MIIDEISFDKVTSWPAECAECEQRAVLQSRVEATIHQHETGHEYANLYEPDDSPAQQLMKAVNKWTSAKCFDCGSHFTDRSNASEHPQNAPPARFLGVSGAFDRRGKVRGD